jgi:hypothetical protein
VSDFQRAALLAVIDKDALAAVLAAFALWLNKRLETFKSTLAARKRIGPAGS